MIGLRKSKLPMIRVHPSIYFITALIVMLGRGGEFIAVLLFVTLHEAAHWAAGVRFGLTLREVLFTPVGERAVLSGVELLAPGRRAAVYLAGPAVSLLLWAGFSLFMPTETGAFCGKINLAVALLNLLPILPLDGGQLLFILAEGRFGTLKSARAFFAAGRALSAVVILCGCAQAVLYPGNLSLVIIGLYLIHAARTEYHRIYAAFFRRMQDPGGGIRPVKWLYCGEDISALKVIRWLCPDYRNIVTYVKDDELCILDQEAILKSVFESKGATNVGGIR